LRGLQTIVAANEFLRASYIAEFNQKFSVPAKQSGNAFIPCQRQLDLVFALQHERSVARDNTVSYDHRVLQIEKTKWRYSLAGCKVTVYEHLDSTISLSYGPHIVGRYTASGAPLESKTPKRAPPKAAPGVGKNQNRLAVEMTPPRKATKSVASRSGLGKSRSKAA
jgi:hypothetical protein